MRHYLNAGQYVIGMEETHYRTGRTHFQILLDEFGSFDTLEEATAAVYHWKTNNEDLSNPKTYKVFQITEPRN